MRKFSANLRDLEYYRFRIAGNLDKLFVWAMAIIKEFTNQRKVNHSIWALEYGRGHRDWSKLPKAGGEAESVLEEL